MSGAIPFSNIPTNLFKFKSKIRYHVLGGEGKQTQQVIILLLKKKYNNYSRIYNSFQFQIK